jgi:holliday junction DNA helicase RuvA
VIGSLRGTLVAKQAPRLLVEVAGVGYEVEAPMSTVYELPAVGEPVFLYTHLVVREDAHTLFGFASEAERSLFRSLLKVNGVGAKVALAILSGISVEGFARSVMDGDISALTRVPGIGKKTAERLVVEMRDRIGGTEPPPAGEVRLSGAVQGPRDEAHAALVALGYKPQEASRLLDAVEGDGLGSEALIRQALQAVARRRG